MKRAFLILTLLCVYALPSLAQGSANVVMNWGTVTPGSCGNRTGRHFYNISTNIYSVCRNGVYVQIAPNTATGGIADPGANGWLVRTALNTTVARSIAVGSNLSITNADGTAGNPTISLGANVATKSGATTNNNCAKWDGSGNLVDAGAPCGSGGGAGVTSLTGTANQVIFSASTGAITATLPQSIGTGSNVQFNGLTVATLSTDLGQGRTVLAAQGGGTEGAELYWTGAGANASWTQDVFAQSFRTYLIDALSHDFIVANYGTGTTNFYLPSGLLGVGLSTATAQLHSKSLDINRSAARFDLATGSTVPTVVIDSSSGGPSPIQTPGMTALSADMGGTVKNVVLDVNGNFGVKTEAAGSALTPLSGAANGHYIGRDIVGTFDQFGPGNFQFFYRFLVQYPITIGAIQYDLQTASGAGGGMEIAVFNSTCNGSKLFTTGAINLATSGPQSVTFSGVTLQPGTYCMVYSGNNGSAKLRAVFPDTGNRVGLDNAPGSSPMMGNCSNLPTVSGTINAGACGTLSNSAIWVPWVKIRGN